MSTTRAEAWTYAALRVIAGALLTVHGVTKLFGVLGHDAIPFGEQLWFGGVIELVGGTLVAIGLFTRAAAFLCSGMLAVAYFQFHWKLAFAGWQWLPAVNGGELAVVYCFLFLYICARGPGPLSLDAQRGAR